MRRISQQTQFLKRGQLWSRHLRGTARVTCEKGTLWLTQSGDSRDYLLRAGEGLELRAGHWVMEPLSDATVQIEPVGKSQFINLRRWRTALNSHAPLPTVK